MTKALGPGGRRMSRKTADRILNSTYAVPLSRAVVVLGCLSLVVAVSLDVRSFVAPVGHAYESAFLPSFLLVFPLWAWTVLRTVAQMSLDEQSTFRWGRLFADVPLVLRLLLLAVAVGGLIAIIPDVSALGAGQPGYDSTKGIYTQNNHGSVTIVSRLAYERAVAGQLRLFLGGAVVFTTVAVASALSHLSSRGSR